MHLVQVGHVAVQVVEAGEQREDGDRHEKEPGEGAQPGAVGEAPHGRVDGPRRQAALVQPQQALVTLPCTPCGCSNKGTKSVAAQLL